MLSQRSSFFRPVVVAAVLALSWNAVRGAQAQTQPQQGPGGDVGEAGPITPEFYEAGGQQQRTSTGQSASNPVFTPGYFEVACPAMCYGAAFHVFGCRAYGGAGYYGPFRRLWGYGTYGPNFNLGAGSPQYGLVGCFYVAQQPGHGLCKHHGCGHPCCDGTPQAFGYGDPGIPPIRGTTNPAAPSKEMGPAKQPAEKLPPPTSNTARLRILVPENAVVLVEGRETAATGTVRDFISPPLPPGKNMLYALVVRYKDAGGKTVEENHSIRVRANDRLDIDCTKPAGADEPRVTVQRP